MPIAHRNLKKSAAARTQDLEWKLLCANAAQPNYLSCSLTGLVVGSLVPSLPLYNKWLQANIIKLTSAGNLTATFKLVGLNQFGEPASETLSFSGVSPVTITSVNVYSKITSVTVLSLSAALQAGDTLNFGYTNVNPVLPMLAKLTAAGPKASSDVNPAGSILAVLDAAVATSAGQPTFQTVKSPSWTINITGTMTALASSPGAIALVRIADGDGTL